MPSPSIIQPRSACHRAGLQVFDVEMSGKDPRASATTMAALFQT